MKTLHNLAVTVTDNVTLLLHIFSFKIKAKFLDFKCLQATIYVGTLWLPAKYLHHTQFRC